MLKRRSFFLLTDQYPSIQESLMTFPDDLLKMPAYHRHVTHFAYNNSTNTVSDQCEIALIT
jgi:hypothetical protein